MDHCPIIAESKGIVSERACSLRLFIKIYRLSFVRLSDFIIIFSLAFYFLCQISQVALDIDDLTSLFCLEYCQKVINSWSRCH